MSGYIVINLRDIIRDEELGESAENVLFPILLDFYSRNGFVNFGTRALDRDETDKLSGESLVQMLKYLD